MAQKTYEDPKEGVSMDREYSKKGKNIPHSGVYRHPNGTVAIVQGDPLWGNTQAQGFARLGFVFEREATEGEIKTLPEIAMDTRKAEEGNLKGLSARLDRLEDANAQSEAALAEKLEENKSLAAEVAELRAKLAEAEKAEKSAAKTEAKEAKAEAKTEKVAADEIAAAGASQVSDAQEQSADKAKADAERVTEAREPASGTTNTKVNEKESK